MKRILCITLSLLMLLPLLTAAFALPIAADTEGAGDAAADAAAAPLHAYVAQGLRAWYSGSQNTPQGHDVASDVWHDLIGGQNMTVGTNDDNYFTEQGLHVKTAKHNFPEQIVSLVNGESFTVEIEFGEFVSIGGSFNTFMNSSNDNFALFRRNSDNVIEWKFGGGSVRPKAPDALNNLPGHLITVTYEYGDLVVIYVDGVEKARADCTLYMGANDLFIGHNDGSKDFEAVYQNIRFYDRALSAGEVLHNAAVDGHANIKDAYVQDGLVSLYSGVSNTLQGYDPEATVWSDLAGQNDLTLSINDNNFFTPEGLRVTGADTTVHHFSQGIVDVVNGNAFTVEILFGDFLEVGHAYGTFMNSTNDKFALYRQVNGNELYFKFSGNTGPERPHAPDALNLLDQGLVTVTYSHGGKCRLYCDGVLLSEVDAPNLMDANDLFIGQRDSVKTFDTTYRSIRFYNRELSAQEVMSNARADGVTAVADALPEIPGYITVAQPVTNVVGDVAMVRSIDSAKEFESMLADKMLPASAMLCIDTSMNVLASDQSKICSLGEFLEATKFSVLPCVVLQSKEQADALAAYLSSLRFYDVQLLSSDREVLCYAREQMPNCIGVLDLRAELASQEDLSREQLLDIRRAVKTYNASIAVLPVHLCNNKDVQYLYDRQVNVWAAASDTPDLAERYYALLSGATGVISDATHALLDVACNQLAENTMTRLPINIGHRGIPSKAPENCIEGAMYAYELGAQVIEIDVYLTKDKQAVLMHDGLTGRTCNLNLPVEESTLEELTALYCNKGFSKKDRFKEAKVPSLDQFLAAFQGTDVRFYIEVKSDGVELVHIIKELVEKYDMYGQCSVIAFSSAVMENFREIYPEMSVGALCQAYMNGETPEAELRLAMQFIGKHNATLNPRFSANGSTEKYDYQQDDLRAAMIRGIQIHPWTFAGSVSAYEQHFMWGYSGLTGDNADVLENTTYEIRLNEVAGLKQGEATALTHTAVSYLRLETIEEEITVQVLSGRAEVTGNVITPTSAEELILVTSSQHTVGKSTYVLYTQPMAFAVEAVEQTTAATPEESTTDPDGEQSEKGCKSAIGAIGLMAFVTVLAGAVLTVGKKDL